VHCKSRGIAIPRLSGRRAWYRACEKRP
jgi:hypothetical protein